MFVYKYSRTLAAVYDVSNSGNVNLKTPVNENDGAVRILLTVPTGLCESPFEPQMSQFSTKSY